jgi:limonene-1,2-epoxide hydrolase
MTPEEVVRSLLAAWDRLDVDAVMSHFAPEAVYENVPIRAVSGYAEVRREVERFLNRTTSFEAEVLNLAVAGNVVMTERVDHTRYAGTLFHARVMGVFEIEGDKIRAWRDYFDMPKDAR